MAKKVLIATTVLAGALMANAHDAHANDYVNYGGGPMKNLYVDVVFWGKNCAPGAATDACFVQDPDPTRDDRQIVLRYITNLASWLNGGYGPDGSTPAPGLEPAIHYYGVSGITPGLWLNDWGDILPNSYFRGQGGSRLDDGNFRPIVSAAQNGGLGYAYDFQGNPASWGLPPSPNRLTLVITKGTNKYCISAHRVYGCQEDEGYHDTMSGNPYGAVMFESPQMLSHEIMEAMSDPIVFNGWIAQNGFFRTNEVADECEGQGGTYSWLTVDPIYSMAGVTTPSASCRLTIPEQHAPMAATFEYGRNGVQPLNLFYIDPNGHVRALTWNYAKQPLSGGPYDYGQPSPTVKAVGKPSAVFDLYAGGEYVFVKGSDGSVWMRNNETWTSLGGQIYGDPQAVPWNWGGDDWIHVAALGLDDHLYLQGVRYGTGFGWGQLPTGSTLFSGSPTIVSRAADSLDVFATGEDGQMKWMQYSLASDWGPARTVNTDPNYNPSNYYPTYVSPPFVTTPAVATLGPNSFTVMGGYAPYLGDSGMYVATWKGSDSYPWVTWDRDNYAWTTWVTPFLDAMPKSLSMYTLQGTPAVVSSGNGRVDAFAVSRGGELWWFYSTDNGTTWYSVQLNSSTFVANPLGAPNQPSPANILPVVSSGVTGDPIAVSRGVNQVEVFYRTQTGSMGHIMFDESDNTWTSEVLFAVMGGSIIYDPAPGRSATQCVAGGWSMHCCPSGYAMVGADVSSNVFKCAPLLTNLAGARTGDSGTRRNNVHSCPYGSVMAGLRADADVLACVSVPNNGIVTEQVDSDTHDSQRGMRACDPGTPTGAMSGIDVGSGLFNCARTAQVQ